MSITLRPIDSHNWQQVAALKVSDEQSHYVASNSDSLLQAKYDVNLRFPVVIYAAEQVVGFALYSYYTTEGWHLSRLMIDREQQGKGYGRLAATQLLAKIGEQPTCAAIKISYHPSNEVARKLFASLGFVEFGRENDNQLAELKLEKEPLPPPSISLREVTAENLRSVIRLKVAPGQEHFVANNATSLAQSKVEPYWIAKAIYDAETPLGFVMYGNTPEYGWFVTRLMTDARYQGRGYGRAAMQLVIDDVRGKDSKQLEISYELDNEVARRFYASLGFVETGEIDEGEAIAVLKLDLGGQPSLSRSRARHPARFFFCQIQIFASPRP